MSRLVDLFGYLAVVFRAGMLTFQSLLLGGVFFLLWIVVPAPDVPESSIGAVRSLSWRWLRISVIGLAIVQVFSLYVQSAVLMATVQIGFWDVVGANFFVAGICVLLAAACIFLVARSATQVRLIYLLLLSAVVLSASVMTNHAAARLTGRPLLITLTFLHEASASIWIGGLTYFVLALFRAREATTRWYLAGRFSRVAVISVGVLLTSGVVISVYYLGSLNAIIGTSYGLMVAGKAAILLVLMMLGGVNFLLLRHGTPECGLPRLRRIVEAELGLGLTAILLAASLTSLPPAVDLGGNTLTPQMIASRMRPTLPRLKYPPLIPVSAEGKPLDDSAKRLTTVRDLDGQFLSFEAVTDAKESEANHHWMGLIVFAMGVLALVAKTGKVRMAEFWPLLLIGISIFIFLRADTESWPVGPQGFWAVWLHPEVLQHRLAALVCAGFAIFEFRVRRHDAVYNPHALVFPLACALGGAVLVTHSHGSFNLKEEAMAELNHLPMGILAVLAGWSRWLELRLPASDRRIPSWIWPACLVAIGLGLLNYREM